MKQFHVVSYALVLVGALNWGLIGLLNVNLVTLLFGAIPMGPQLVYVLVGAAAVVEIATHKSMCKDCMKMWK